MKHGKANSGYDSFAAEAFAEGKIAWESGETIDANPYDERDSDLYNKWRTGWFTARKHSH